MFHFQEFKALVKKRKPETESASGATAAAQDSGSESDSESGSDQEVSWKIFHYFSRWVLVYKKNF